MDMARNSTLPTRLVVMLIVSLMVATATPALTHDARDIPVPADTLQTADSGAVLVLVTDDVGRPIGEAVVTVVDLTLTNRTNSSGYALFEHLPTDANWTQYSVSATKSGYNPSGVAVVTVSPWNTTRVTLEIYGGIIYGVVEDAIGPISGATVSVTTLGYSNTTNVDGIYSIKGVPGNTPTYPSYAVTTTASGYANQTKEVILETGDFKILDFMMVSLTGAVAGTIWHATTEEPLYNVSVSVRVGTVTVTVTSDTDGTYRIPDLPSGTYTVTAAMSGFYSLSISDVVVVSGSDTSDVDFMLIEKPTKLYGVVRSGTLLVPGVMITVSGAGLYANTSVDGEYEISNITAGTYSVVASREGYVSVTIFGVIIPRGGEVQVNINMQSLPGSSLTGLVLSSDTGAALPGVEVVVIGLATQRSTITNVYGQFEITGLTGGNYTVRFLLEGYKPKELSPVVVPEDGTTTLDQVGLEPVAESFGGFIFGFDLAHSMMIMALFLTIIILALAVLLRIRTFEAPDKAPAVYDQEGEEEEGEERKPAAESQKDKQKKKDKKRK